MITTSASGLPERPVGKIVAVGRNYLDHASEMGAARPAEPILFLKPSTALLLEPHEIELPAFSQHVHHEVELVVRLSRSGRDMTVGEAEGAIDAYALGLDLTARDLQAQAKTRGEPWSVAKGFDGSAPVSRLRRFASVRELDDLPISLAVNGDTRQADRTANMLFSVSELVAFSSSRFSWQAGDLLFTGTPAGVGRLKSGDAVSARLGDLGLDLIVR